MDTSYIFCQTSLMSCDANDYKHNNSQKFRLEDASNYAFACEYA